MAEPTHFTGENKIFTAPPTMPEVGDLPTYVENQKGAPPQIISCWRLSAEEFEMVKQTGVIWVSIIGQAMPPIAISAVAMVAVEGKPAEPLENAWQTPEAPTDPIDQIKTLDPDFCAQCDKPSVTELDGSKLCRDHADKWVQGEGRAAQDRTNDEQAAADDEA